MTPTFFHAGFPKTGTTWLHACLLEHPEVFVPHEDAIHFLTIHHHKGLGWYEAHFSDYCGEKEIGDTTPSYACYEIARERMKAINPEAKILLSLRNPIERAFSHYWHLKRKGHINFDFDDVLGNSVEIFQTWVGFGFYYDYIVKVEDLFGRDNILILLYEDLEKDPLEYCRTAFRFLEVDPTFQPSAVSCHINSADPRTENSSAHGRLWSRLNDRIIRGMKGIPQRGDEYSNGVPRAVREELRQVYEPHNHNLAEYLNVDLSHWC